MKSGLLIINLGTPAAPDRTAVKQYLSEFLSDKRIIDLPWLVRFFLVHGLIIPFRIQKSIHAYKKIWTAQGSPLLYHSKQLATQLQNKLPETKVVLAMRYGHPSLKEGLEELKQCTTITVLPLYPQYSSAATGSSLEALLNIVKHWEVIPSLKIISHFYQHPAYIKAQTNHLKKYLKEEHYILFSYHGIPERQIHKNGCNIICSAGCIKDKNPHCYRSQCYQTSYLIAQELNLSSTQYTTSFQSRLGKTPWIKPYTEEQLEMLAAKGVKNLAISCPSFVADCLETLEEIGIRAQKQWTQLGGQQFTLIPSMNNCSIWVQALIDLCEIKMN